MKQNLVNQSGQTVATVTSIVIHPSLTQIHYLGFQSANPHGYQQTSAGLSLLPVVEDWLRENLRGRYTFRQAKQKAYNDPERIELRFFEEHDALHFKMRWQDGLDEHELEELLGESA